MYPRISDLTRDLFGFGLPFPIYSYGFMVALAVLAAAFLTSRELDRLYRQGRIGSVRVEEPDRKRKGRTVTKNASPSAIVPTSVLLAVVLGVVGARLFYILENLGQFTADPLGMIFSAGGLTFYGGLITAGFGLGYYIHRQGIHLPTFLDATAPGLMAAYGIGRIGCHLAGDGDWGITADMALKPDLLPTWLWAETYPNNILGVTLPEPGVYPTPIYEFVACAIVLLGALWLLRDHPFKSGWLFSVYVILTGGWRILIEMIRVNEEYAFLGMMLTQAQIISIFLILAGLVGLYLTMRRREEDAGSRPSPEAASAEAS